MFTGQFAVISNKATWLSPVVEAVDDSTNDQLDLSAVGLTVDVVVTIKDMDGCTLVTASLSNLKAALTSPAPAGVQWQFEVSDLSSLCAGTYRLGVKVTVNDFVSDLIDGTIAVVEGD